MRLLWERKEIPMARSDWIKKNLKRKAGYELFLGSLFCYDSIRNRKNNGEVYAHKGKVIDVV